MHQSVRRKRTGLWCASCSLRAVLGALVLPHVSLLPEASAAHVARVRLFTGVYLDVIVQCLRAGECFLTVVAFVSAVAAVYQSVLVENGPGQEGFVADVAFERSLPRVLLPRVIRQVGLDRETLVAILASVGLDAHVKSLVSPHVAGLGVTLAADVTDVRPQPVVSPLVSVEGIGRGQQTAANVAGELGALVSPVVLHLLAVVEYVPAKLAEKLGVTGLGQSGRAVVPLLLVLVQQGQFLHIFVTDVAEVNDEHLEQSGVLLPVQDSLRERFVGGIARVAHVRSLNDVATLMSLQAVHVGEVAVAEFTVIQLGRR